MLICKSPSFFQKGIMFKSHLQQNFFFLLFRKFDVVPFDEKSQKAICLVFCRRKIVLFTENSFFTFNELWRQQSDYQPESTSGNHDTKKVT